MTSPIKKWVDLELNFKIKACFHLQQFLVLSGQEYGMNFPVSLFLTKSSIKTLRCSRLTVRAHQQSSVGLQAHMIEFFCHYCLFQKIQYRTSRTKFFVYSHFIVLNTKLSTLEFPPKHHSCKLFEVLQKFLLKCYQVEKQNFAVASSSLKVAITKNDKPTYILLQNYLM